MKLTRRLNLALVASVALATAVSLGLENCEGEFPAGLNTGPGTGTASPSVTINILPGASNLGTQAFGPNPQAVNPGTLVTWVNTDSIAHSVASTTGLWNSGAIQPGQSYSRTFNEIGTFPYVCDLHPGSGESGTLQVNQGTASPAPTISPSPVVEPSPVPLPTTGFPPLFH